MVINHGCLMSSLILLVAIIAALLAGVAIFLTIKKKKTGEAVKEAQLDLIGLGGKDVSS